MAKFNMSDLLNNKSKENSNTEGTFKVKNIPIKKIVPNEKNFYKVEDISELKESILLVGLQQNLVVREIPGTDNFSMITGHRRLKALTELAAEGHKEFETAPCKIETDVDDIMSELKLIFTNSTTRELSDYEKIQQMSRLKELLMTLKQRGIKFNGRMRELVAESLKVSPAQVGRMESIESNLSPEFKEELKNNKVNFSTAYELSSLPEPEQKEVYEKYQEKGNISIKDVKDKKITEKQPMVKPAKQYAKLVKQELEKPERKIEDIQKILDDKNQALLLAREALKDMHFAYINKDEYCPHTFEITALKLKDKALTAIEKALRVNCKTVG